MTDDTSDVLDCKVSIFSKKCAIFTDMKRIIFSLFLISAVCTAAFADEGMWMTDKVDKRTRELCAPGAWFPLRDW